jgi:AraC-like DNA-binding protein
MQDKNNFNSNIIYGKHWEEQIGNTVINIYTGSLCQFNEYLRTNGIHTHNCFELCIVIKGQGYFIHDNNKYFVEKGNVFVADPNVPHEIYITQGQEMQIVYFFVEIVSNSKSEITNIDERCLNNFLRSHKTISRDHPNILAYFDFIESYSDNKYINTYGIYKAIRNLTIESLMSLSINADLPLDVSMPASSSQIDRAIFYILNNLNKSITLKELSDYLHMSQRNIQYLFKKKLNTTIKNFINENRIGLATTYLKANYNITQVCLIMGYSNISQFSKMYKKHCGVSPKLVQNSSIDSNMNIGCFYEN